MTTETKKRFRNYENFLTITMFAVFGLVFLDRMALSFIFPYISEDLGMNNTQLGIIIAVMSVCFAFSSIIFSSISDFLGKKKNDVNLFYFSIFIGDICIGFSSILCNIIVS